MSILYDNIPLICWSSLSTNPSAKELLEQNIDRVNWRGLSLNPSCMDILEKNISLVDWINISANPEIFVLDYKAIKERIQPFVEELMMKCYHPMRVERYLIQYNYDIGDDIYE
jgi:hypothetical protein